MLLSDKYPFLTNYFTLELNQKMPQSIVLYGNDFESQYVLAKEIGRLLNCVGDKTDDCNCLNCQWVNSNTHPAVLTISKLDNKPDDDTSKTVISIKQAQKIKEELMTSSEFHRVYIFCDKDENGNIKGLNSDNFQTEAANSLLKTVEEPLSNVTFIFLVRYIEDILSTIISRSQCFFVPSYLKPTYDYSLINDVFENYWNFNRKDVFDISQKLTDLSTEHSTIMVLEHIQNYLLNILKSNKFNTTILNQIKLIEQYKKQSELGIKPSNIFDDLCLNFIK